MSLALVIKELEKAMIPINTRQQQYLEKKSQQGGRGGRGTASLPKCQGHAYETWLIYRNLWLKKLDKFPDAYPTYDAKITHIERLWQIGNNSIAQRRLERVQIEALKQEVSINRQAGFMLYVN